MVWSVPTGRNAFESGRAPHIFGLNYDPRTDALIGLAKDNHNFVLDRRTGKSLLSEPYSIPNIAPSPSREIQTSPRIMEWVENAARPLFGETPFSALISPLLGNETLIGNYFSIDPHSGGIWIAATAPDLEDGVKDGVSELGSLMLASRYSAPFRSRAIMESSTSQQRPASSRSLMKGKGQG